jgi:triacylglycerol lipase
MSVTEAISRHRSAGARRQRDVMSPFSPTGGARRLVGKIERAAMVQAYELGLMASIAARAPLHLVGAGLDPAFGALPMVLAHPAPAARPVLLVHGFGSTKSSWSYLAQTLNAEGHTFDAITYTPLGTSVEQLAERLAVEVERMLSQTGADKVHLVGHSLGGVVIAQAIASGPLGLQCAELLARTPPEHSVCVTSSDVTETSVVVN